MIKAPAARCKDDRRFCCGQSFSRPIVSITVFACGLLSGCMVGPNYKAPDSHAGEHYDPRAENQLASATTQHITLGANIGGEWWSALGSAKLDSLMRRTIDGNLDLTAADATIAGASEAVKVAEGGLYPQVDYGSELTRGRFAGAPAPFLTSLYAIGPQVSFDLDIFGGTNRKVEQQAALAELQKHRFDAAYLTLTGDVATEALTLASARAQISAVGTLLDDDRKNLDLVRTARLHGIVTDVDVALAESQLSQDQTLLPPLAQKRDAARHALSVLAGKGPADWVPPDFDLTDFVLPGDLPVSLPSALAHNRPDILEAEAELHAASAGIGVATADLYPHLVLSASVAQVAPGPGTLLEGGSTLWGIAAGLAGPLFHGGALNAKRRAAVDEYKASLAEYRQTVITSLGQVADVLQAIAHDAEEYAAQVRALKAAGTSLRLTRLAYQQGEVGLLEVLDAERAYQRALLGQIAARTARYLDTTDISVALGGHAAGAFAQRSASHENTGGSGSAAAD